MTLFRNQWDCLPFRLMVQNGVRTWGFHVTLNLSNINRFSSQPRKTGGMGFSEAWDMCAENFHYGSFLPLCPQANATVFVILSPCRSQQNSAVPSALSLYNVGSPCAAACVNCWGALKKANVQDIKSSVWPSPITHTLPFCSIAVALGDIVS